MGTEDKLHKIVEARKTKVANNHIYEDRSKERLKTIVESKCTTILIGTLAAFERKFGKSWGVGSSILSEKQKAILTLWKECRKEVLDKGNANIRDLGKELDEYSISWDRKTYKLEVDK